MPLHRVADTVQALSKPLLTLEIDLEDIPDLPKKEKGGVFFWYIAFDVYMTVHSAHLTFVLGRGDRRYKPKHVTFSQT